MRGIDEDDENFDEEALAELTDRINRHCAAAGMPAMTVEQVALGFIQVANETMVRPIREISVLRGFDSKEHVLAVFGGAGPQHACAIAENKAVAAFIPGTTGGLGIIIAL